MKPQLGPFPDIFRRQLPALTILSLVVTLAACTPAPQKVIMPDPGNTAQSSTERNPEQSVPEATAPMTVTKTAGSDPLIDTPAEALGRRILSTAFVRVGPDGHLTVELHDGRVMVLRDVVMGPKDYCGVQVAGNTARTKYCGGYAEVAAARSGGGELPVSEVSNAGEPARSPAKGN